MKYRVSLNLPNSPRGEEFDVPPVGRIENGSFVEVDLSDSEASRLSGAYGVEVEPTDDYFVEEGGEDEI